MPNSVVHHEEKNIVVFGSNGGIGSDVVRRLAEAIADGKPYHVTIVSRKDKAFGEAQLMELKESFPKGEIKGDLEANLSVGPKFDPKHLEGLEPVLKNADMVVCAAGLPRPSPPPERSALIYPNAPVVKNIAEAMAKYAKADSVLLLGTNPLDNTVQIADETLRKTWKKEGRVGELPEVKVFGMAATLDEARLRVYTAKILNQALKEAGKGASSRSEAERTGKVYVRPQDVDGQIYGQHGPAMVVDLPSVTIEHGGEKISLDKFIKKHNLADEMVTVAGESKSLGEAISQVTVDGGKKILDGIGRTTQVGGAGQIFGMIKDYFSDKPKKINACVVAGFMDDKEKIGYGRPVEIGGSKVKLAEFSERVHQDSGLQQRIIASRNEVKKHDEYYRKCAAAEEHILQFSKKEGGLSIGMDADEHRHSDKKAHDLNVEVTVLKGKPVTEQELLSIKEDFATITKASSVEVSGGSDPKIHLVVKSNNTAPLDTLAEALGIRVEHRHANKEMPSKDISSVRGATALGGVALGGIKAARDPNAAHDLGGMVL